jgi:hypothetical protein
VATMRTPYKISYLVVSGSAAHTPATPKGREL